jgi:hypothetical protein
MNSPLSLKPLGFTLEYGRKAYSLELSSLADLPQDFRWPSRRFTCLLMLDAASSASASLPHFAEHLLRDGCVYISSWGPRCKYVHDIFDETLVELEVDAGLTLGTVMTTWHSDKPLSDAIDFFALWAKPVDALRENCDSAVLISVAHADWAAEGERLLANYAI